MEEYTETNRTFVISTHIIEEAEDIFEDVIILDEGKILRNENTQELLERSFHVSGLAEEVDAACEGLTVYQRKPWPEQGRDGGAGRRSADYAGT